jgi:hypothetical protein
MPAEHAMFEMIMSGMSIEQILMAGTAYQEESSDDIELF